MIFLIETKKILCHLSERTIVSMTKRFLIGTKPIHFTCNLLLKSSTSKNDDMDTKISQATFSHCRSVDGINENLM